MDARSSVLYKEGWSGVTAHAIGSEMIDPRPLVAARGFLFARAYVPRGTPPYAICSHEGLRLAPRANLGFDAGIADALVPSDDSVPAQLAFPITTARRSGQPPRYGLRLYALTPDGDLQLQDEAQTFDAVGQVVFHPSGRFLYATVGTALWGYSFGPEGHLTKVEDVPAGAGRMVVTNPH